MAESIVSSVIDKLKDPLLEEVTFLYSVSGKVQSMRQKLEWIKSFLEDAEARSNESKVIQHWVGEVREVAYRIEDAIDIYVVEIQGERMLGSHLIACIKWVYEGLIMKLIALHNLGVELDDIEATLQKINENRSLFNINDLGESSRAREEAERRPSLEYIDDESRIIGLEAHKIILEKLLKPHPDLSVISIVGTGGLGKTTLAQKVFNSAGAKQKFNIRIWISVSQEFKRIQIFKKILEDIREVKQEERDRDEVYFIKEIRKSLAKETFLIVLDDVWSETFWPNHIKVACPPASEINEGRVLITTRDHNVAQKAESEPFELQLLNPEESKMLLYKIAFPKQTPPGGLDSLATELVKKCGYLPLALVVVGGMLWMKKSYSEWRKVTDSIEWRGECMPILAASYNNMPIVLKTCFMYLASFPEDHEIDAKSLVRKWIAEDLISDEVTGNNCLEKLVQRCLIIASRRSYDGSLERCRLHDLLRELAIREAKKKKFLSVFVNENPHQSFNDARRASLQSCTFGDSNFENQKKVKRNYNKKLRSLLVFSDCLPDELSGFKLLKVLKMHDCVISFSKLEKWFEELIHLRHLELRYCRIDPRKIPETIGHLKNLLTFDCTGTVIKELPESLWTITTLRHVLVGGLIEGSESPLPLANLPNLRTLRTVDFKSPSPTLDALRNFSKLHELSLLNSDPWVATLLKELNQLVSLKIGSSSSPPLPFDVLDMRAFPFYKNLQCLFVHCCWPEHVEIRSHFFPPRLTRLHILFSFKKDPMPELEQLQNLEILELEDARQYKGITLTCSAGGFPQLQQLQLENLQAKELSLSPGAMPMLKKLSFTRSMKLKKIPELQHLNMLQEFYWSDADYSDEEMQAMQEENQHELQHIPSVVIQSRLLIEEQLRVSLRVQQAALQFINTA